MDFVFSQSNNFKKKKLNQPTFLEHSSENALTKSFPNSSPLSQAAHAPFEPDSTIVFTNVFFGICKDDSYSATKK